MNMATTFEEFAKKLADGGYAGGGGARKALGKMQFTAKKKEEARALIDHHFKPLEGSETAATKTRSPAPGPQTTPKAMGRSPQPAPQLTGEEVFVYGSPQQEIRQHELAIRATNAGLEGLRLAHELDSSIDVSEAAQGAITIGRSLSAIDKAAARLGALAEATKATGVPPALTQPSKEPRDEMMSPAEQKASDLLGKTKPQPTAAPQSALARLRAAGGLKRGAASE
jgi:hypothetical protein